MYENENIMLRLQTEIMLFILERGGFDDSMFHSSYLKFAQTIEFHSIWSS